MSAQHTPGPWRKGDCGGCVVADTPIADGADSSDSLAYYGGHLIAESIALKNMPIIAAAPDLLAACRLQHDAIDILMAMLISARVDPPFMPSQSVVWPAVLAGSAAIAKATGSAS